MMATYTITPQQDDDGTWWVHVPELPGCFAAADTLQELHSAVAEAIVLYLDGEEDEQQLRLDPPPDGWELRPAEPMQVHVATDA